MMTVQRSLCLATMMLAWLIAVPALAAASKPDASKAALPAGFVHLTDVAPGVMEDMRYASQDNFTGAKVPGYKAGRCILAKPVAQALARVQLSISTRGYALKVYDCYRPVRAVQAFMRWAKTSEGGHSTKYYFPRLARQDIIPRGYIAERSSHSRGTAVDLTLVQMHQTTTENSPSGRQGNAADDMSCIARKHKRRPDNSLDMGTSWDCFDVRSHTLNEAVPVLARKNRKLLLAAMKAEGFRNYKREWWHFSWPAKGYSKAHNFPVE